MYHHTNLYRSKIQKVTLLCPNVLEELLNRVMSTTQKSDRGVYGENNTCLIVEDRLSFDSAEGRIQNSRETV